MARPPRVATFMFHEVTDDPASSGWQRPGAYAYKHRVKDFAAYLDAIAGGPVAPTLTAAVDFATPGQHVLLTFDDGGVSALAAAAMLEARGWLGHFFIVTSRIGASGFLSADQLRALRRAGHSMGSHSHSHPNIFRELPTTRMLEEWRVSGDVLSQILGEPCLTASVPGGDISERVFASARAAGLRYLFTSEPWLTPRRVDDCWILGRFSVKVATTPARVGALARFRGWQSALVRRRLKVLATRSLPLLYRLYIRRRTRESTTV